MAYEVKLGYISGQEMVFTAFQPSGAGRGVPNQPLTEVRPTGYYFATPITALETGDIVLAYVAEKVTWEDAPVSVLTEDSVYYEGDRVSYEGDWVFDFDNTVVEKVVWVGEPVAQAEYDEAMNISADLDEILIAQRIVRNVETDPDEITQVITVKNL
ncbi:MAG: hypothetical protein PHF37_03290 [Phycisphaerae bacterium]|nr:hypothetical protein [Phycisphaerae bacterium]